MFRMPEHGICDCDKHFEIDEFFKNSTYIKSIIDDLIFFG